jgi:hypothetical protein
VNHRRSTALLLIASVFATSCSWWSKRDVQTCADVAARPDAPFDSTNAASLAGRYQLVVISESSNQFSHSDRGPLELFATNATGSTAGQAASPGRSPGSPLLWGAADMTPHEITIPWVYNPSSRDPNRPGLRVYANGDVDLGGRHEDGTPGVSMHIESVARDGFGGTWTSVPEGTLPIDANGKPLPVPHGRFCALRRG